MPLIEWKDSYDTGLADIDAQHRHLADVINRLADAMKDKRAKEELSTIIMELMKYAAKHFSLEERYFNKYGYPEAEAHIEEHERFEAKVNDFVQGFQAGRVGLSLEIITFLGNWLVSHVTGTDKLYAPFLLEKGAGAEQY